MLVWRLPTDQVKMVPTEKNFLPILKLFFSYRTSWKQNGTDIVPVISGFRSRQDWYLLNVCYSQWIKHVCYIEELTFEMADFESKKRSWTYTTLRINVEYKNHCNIRNSLLEFDTKYSWGEVLEKTWLHLLLKVCSIHNPGFSSGTNIL